MTTTQPQTTRKVPAPYLTRFDYWLDDVHFVCWMDYEAGDDSVGMSASAWLVHAYVGDSGMDVAELLAPAIVTRIEEEAAAALGEERGRSCSRY